MAKNKPQTPTAPPMDEAAIAALEAEFANADEIEAVSTQAIEVGQIVVGVYHGPVTILVPGMGDRIAHDIGESRYWGSDLLNRKLQEVTPGMRVFVRRDTKGGQGGKAARDSAKYTVKAK